MREIAITRQYKKDIERLLKQGKNMGKVIHDLFMPGDSLKNTVSEITLTR
jgi:mRNA-degrading endonuclease YafQ of YafQ-DinJ toxin-antitoxin module